MDTDELGLMLAYAAHVRNSAPILREALLDLDVLGLKKFGKLPFTLSRRIQELQKKGDSADAVAWMVWLHTARAGQDPALRFLAKQMWAVLEPGFPHVTDAAAGFSDLTHQALDIARATDFPVGLDPHR